MNYKRIYICHPYSGDPAGNIKKVESICKSIANTMPTKSEPHRMLPIAPQIYLSHFIDPVKQRNLGLNYCYNLLRICDTVMVCGDEITDGMKLEIEYANCLNLTVIYTIVYMPTRV